MKITGKKFELMETINVQVGCVSAEKDKLIDIYIT